MSAVEKPLLTVSVTIVTIALGLLGGADANGLCSAPVHTCGECLQLHPDCAWCGDRDLDIVKCGTEAELLGRGCSSGDVQSPAKSLVAIRDMPLSIQTPTVRPQEQKLRLRKGEEVTLKVEVAMGWNDPFVSFDTASPPWVKVVVGHYCLDFSLSSAPGACGRADNGKQPLVVFDIAVKLTGCPPNGSTGPYLILIRPKGHQDLMTVALDPLCSCDCEKPENVEQASNVCMGRGTEACGACTCDAPYFGKHCECDSTVDSNADCIKPDDNPGGLSCSGRGECVCGQCDCYKVSPYSHLKYSGTYCECNNFNCPYNQMNGFICGGPERGRCVCGECQCHYGYTGSSCENFDPLVFPCNNAFEELCSGRGECVDNACVCHPPSSGDKCETCEGENCECDLAKDCVLCRVFQSGLSESVCYARCVNTETHLVDAVPQEAGLKVCRVQDPADGCNVTFTVDLSPNGAEHVHYVGVTKECPERSIFEIL